GCGASPGLLPCGQVARMAELALGKGEDLASPHDKHKYWAAGLGMCEPCVRHVVAPSAIPRGGPRSGESFERASVGDAFCLALDDDVESVVPLVAPRSEDDGWVAGEVTGLLFLWSCTEMECLVEPHSDERRHVRPPVGPHGRDPGQLRCFQRSLGSRPG